MEKFVCFEKHRINYLLVLLLYCFKIIVFPRGHRELISEVAM